MRIRHLVPTAMLALSALSVAGGASADNSSDAQSWVEKEHGHIRKLLDDNAPQSQIHDALDRIIDTTEVTNRTLGNPCPVQVPNCTNLRTKLSDSEYAQVSELMAKLVEKNYKRNLKKTKDYDVTYRGAREAADNIVKVRTEAKNKTKPRDPAVQVDYLVMKKGDRFTSFDIIAEGSSMNKNYYKQFLKMLDDPNKGPSYLISKLQKKVNAPEKDSSSEKEE